MKKVPEVLKPLAKEAMQYKSAEEFVTELNRVIKKYNSATLGASEAQRGLVVKGGGLTKTEDSLHFAYLQGLEKIGGYTGSSFTDFYNQVTK